MGEITASHNSASSTPCANAYNSTVSPKDNPCGCNPPTIAANGPSTSCDHLGPSMRTNRNAAGANPTPASASATLTSSFATDGRTINRLANMSAAATCDNHSARAKYSATSEPRSASVSCVNSSTSTSVGASAAIFWSAINPNPIAVTWESAKCVNQRCVLLRPSGDRGSIDSSRNHVPTYSAGSTTSRCNTHARTPWSGSHPAIRDRQSSPRTCAHAPKSCATPPSVKCSGAVATTNWVAPSKSSPESRYTWAMSGGPTTNGGFATIRSNVRPATGSNHDPSNSSACGNAPAAAKVASAMSNARGCTSVNVTCDAQPSWASACTPEPAPRSNAESTGVWQVIRSSDKLAAPTPTT